ncbi:Dual oxidase [Lamellibrachia satsuma]|nr:Dual oxidase [Lamellibrachia satsuma]
MVHGLLKGISGRFEEGAEGIIVASSIANLKLWPTSLFHEKDVGDDKVDSLVKTCLGQDSGSSPAKAHNTRQRFDGWFNNLGNPSWGAAGEDILFNVAPAYSDMTYQLAGIERPNPRVISNNVFDGPTGLPSYRNHTALFAFFSQMVSFEVVDATEGMCPLEMVKVPVPKNDSQFQVDGVTEEYMPFVRSAYNRDTGLSPNNPRRPINRVSSWIDGSFVYGRGEVWCNCLRKFTGGLLLTTDHLGYYPGYNHHRLPLDNLPDPITHEKMEPEKQWGFGNVHIHQNPGLMAVALVWFRYHNHVAARLRNSHPAKADDRWSNERWKDEQIFQAARRHVIAVMQVILPGSVDQIQSNGIIVGEGRGGE